MPSRSKTSLTLSQPSDASSGGRSSGFASQDHPQQIHRTAELTDTRQQAHSYYTRSAALHFNASNRSVTPNTSDSSKSSRRVKAQKRPSQVSLTNSSESTIPLVVHLSRSRGGDDSIRILRNNRSSTDILPTVPFARLNESSLQMDYPTSCQSRTRLRAVSFLSLVAILTFVGWYIHNRFSESNTFFVSVQDDLCKIKDEMQKMKHNVEKGTKRQLEAMEKDTKEKLDTVEKLLTDIKKSQKQLTYSTPCPGGPPSPEAAKVEDKTDKNSEVRELVTSIIDEYNADKTGKTDFALESSGGSIITCGSTEPYNPSSVTSLFGIPLCYSANGPRAIIQASVLPGECWAFKGSSGSVIIQLLGYVTINSVSLEHISKSISPSGDIDSAPKEFSVWGLTSPDDRDGHFFGQFVYDINGPTIQHFDVDSGSKSYNLVEFKVHSNHGNPLYTCVYRLRVHGTLDAVKSGRAGKM